MPTAHEAKGHFVEVKNGHSVDTIWKGPRKQPKQRRTAPPARTLTPTQLIEANRILAEKGTKAMAVYLDQCKHTLVEATPAISQHRNALPADPLARARVFLEIIGYRVKAYSEELETLLESERALTERIAAHDRITDEVGDLVQARVRVKPDRPASAPSSLARRGKSAPFGIRDIRAKVLPILRAEGVKVFGPHDVVKALPKAGLAGDMVNAGQMSAWLHSGAKAQGSGFTRAAVGQYTFTTALQQT